VSNDNNLITGNVVSYNLSYEFEGNRGNGVQDDSWLGCMLGWAVERMETAE
jgi:hypothetical protein